MGAGPVFDHFATTLSIIAAGPVFDHVAEANPGLGAGPIFDHDTAALPPIPGRTSGGGPSFGAAPEFLPGPIDPNSLPRAGLGSLDEFDPPQLKTPFGTFRFAGTGSGFSPGTIPIEGAGFGAGEQA